MGQCSQCGSLIPDRQKICSMCYDSHVQTEYDSHMQTKIENN